MDGQKGRKGVKPSNELVEADAKVGNSKEEVLFCLVHLCKSFLKLIYIFLFS
jgi:hypothetical protein